MTLKPITSVGFLNQLDYFFHKNGTNMSLWCVFIELQVDTHASDYIECRDGICGSDFFIIVGKQCVYQRI